MFMMFVTMVVTVEKTHPVAGLGLCCCQSACSG